MLKPMTTDSKGERQMTNNEILDTWDKFLADELKCYADENGNRPCDNGAKCDRCADEKIHKKFREKIGIGA